MMDHLTMGQMMGHRLMGHPAWTTLAGGATGTAGMGHTAGQVVASLGHDVMHHPLGAAVAAVVLFVVASVHRALRRRRRGARRRQQPASTESHDWSWGEKVTTLTLTGLAAAVMWILATVKTAPAKAAVPHPKVTHTTIVQPVITHVTQVTKAAAGGIPTGAWVAICLAMAFLLVAFLNRTRRHHPGK